MKYKKILLISLFTILVIITTRFYCGVFTHDEFGNDVYFIKHRPTWKWRFYSPIGMSNLEISQLNEEQKYEQKMFDEFIDKRIER